MKDTYGRRERRIAGALILPDPWDVDVLTAQIAKASGRPIRVRRIETMGDTLSGTVMRLPAEDVIFLRASLRGLHRDHVQCHELGHLLAGHLQNPGGYAPGGDSGLAEAAEWMLPRQCDYVSAHEREAEHIAELILARVRQVVPGVRGGANPRTVSGLGSALR